MNGQATAEDRFQNQLDVYGHWRDRLTKAVQSYLDWLERWGGLKDTAEELRLYELLDSLRSDTLMIALVGEFSRGKTELINAIFFSDYKRRLLPCTPGRTTMCPTEILYDPQQDPSIRLLPIETRKSALTIAEHKRSPVGWTTLPLNIDSAESMADALQELVRTKNVTEKEARDLGLLSILGGKEEVPADPSNEVDIPVWRHAIINYPHDLLRQGLVLLDTPGLNALGSEPELTLSMLPAAHAVLFVLAADTGVTRSDLEIWRHHVCVGTKPTTHSRVAALNKIDTLWDELKTDEEVAANVLRQVDATARQLALDTSNVFPVSAHKGLVARIKDDADLLERSGLAGLETKLSSDIIHYKQQLIREKLTNELGEMVETSRDMVLDRVETVHTELDELQALRGKGDEFIRDMSQRLRERRGLFEKEVDSFQVTRRMLSNEVRELVSVMDMKEFDAMIVETRKVMAESWTTAGLRRGMELFFRDAARRLKQVDEQSQAIRKTVDDIYDRFHHVHQLRRMTPPKLPVNRYVRRFDQLEAEAEAFRNSAVVVMTEQHQVIKKFFITMVSRAREIYADFNKTSRAWARAVLEPIAEHIHQNREAMERRLNNLEQLQTDHAALLEREQELQNSLNELNGQLELIDEIRATINERPPSIDS